MEIKETLQLLTEKIICACNKVKRAPNEITIIGVTKSQSEQAIISSAEAGLLNIGESYVQEALQKIEAVSQKEIYKKITWHFLGRLQTNKIKVMFSQ